jgi:MFS family permease
MPQQLEAALPVDVPVAPPALAVLVVGMFMSVLDTSVVNAGLPPVQIDLGISPSDGQWVSTAYLRGLTPVDTGLALIPQALVLAVLLPLTGLLYDRCGARWLAVLGK